MHSEIFVCQVVGICLSFIYQAHIHPFAVYSHPTQSHSQPLQSPRVCVLQACSSLYNKTQHQSGSSSTHASHTISEESRIEGGVDSDKVVGSLESRVESSVKITCSLF